MHGRITIILFLTAAFYSLSISAAVQGNTGELAQLKTEAISIVKKFASTLKPQLKHAMQTGGPTLAINVCSVQAPVIASNLSGESGWTVKRVSLKPRNNSLATADAWEADVLENFDTRQQNGEPVNKLVHAEIIDGQYRLMKAQPVEPLCLTCHGQNLSAEVKESLGEHYSDDQATGYIVGQVRGAISLTKNL